MKNIFIATLFFSTITFAALDPDLVPVKKPYVVPGYDDSNTFDNVDSYLKAKDAFNKLSTETTVDSIFYKSDDYRVKGFILQPKNIPEGKKLPVIVFNRGGNRVYSRIGLDDIVMLNEFVKKGYIVVASDYRGVEGGQGKDEFGGSDVHDIAAIDKVAKSLDHADASNITSVGIGRGAMMTALSIKQGNTDYKKAVMISAECDLEKGRHGVNDITPVYNEIMPGYADGTKEEKLALLKERSSCAWPEKLKLPIDIMTSSDPENVDEDQSEMLKSKLIGSGNKNVKLEKFDGDDDFIYQLKTRKQFVESVDNFIKGDSTDSQPATAPTTSK